MYVIVVYVPVEQVSDVIRAMAEQGAGEIGNYRACAFQAVGQGQFEPKAGAEPFIGDIGRLETVEETRVEMVCTRENLEQALKALISSHPYEEPAYHVLEAKTLADFASGEEE